jgi:hypothetical protein
MPCQARASERHLPVPHSRSRKREAGTEGVAQYPEQRFKERHHSRQKPGAEQEVRSLAGIFVGGSGIMTRGLPTRRSVNIISSWGAGAGFVLK